MAKEFKVNRYYQNMCAAAMEIVMTCGDRFMTRTEWQYPRELYDHLMSCPECEKRNTGDPKKCLLVPLSPLEVKLLVEALREMNVQVKDTEKSPAVMKLLATLEGEVKRG